MPLESLLLGRLRRDEYYLFGEKSELHRLLGSPLPAFPPGEAYDKNLTYAAGRCPARRYLERLLWGLAERRWDPTPIISHRLPLAAGQDAYRMFAERREGCTKVVFRPAG